MTGSSATPAEWEGLAGRELATRWGVPRVEAFEMLGSTNDTAKELLKAGCLSGTVVVSDVQTAGRGRQGKSWASHPGCGLLFSVAVRWKNPPAQLALWVGAACAEAIERATGLTGVGVKWPNDLVIGSRKVSGILCEAVPDGVVVGVGINVLEPGPSEDLPDLATSLEANAGKTMARLMIADSVIPDIVGLLDAPEHLARLVTAVAKRDALEGARIRTEAAGEGVGAGIDADGALLLERGDGSRVRVVSGSVTRI